ncbi:MAG: hypothetical protein JW929_00935 [Anaerolineales bacterium]|nr:hypothetical protein [Anaerolineales bacterium]
MRDRVNLAADNFFRKAGTTVKPCEETAVPVGGALCRVSRNPIHLGWASIVSGAAELPGSFPPRVAASAFVFFIDRRVIAVEAGMLKARGGESRRAYTPRIRRRL